MSNRKIDPYYKQFSDMSYQTSPSWMVTFVRFEQRDQLWYKTDSQTMSTRGPLCVINDCINISVTQSKSSYSQNASLTLVSGDINYLSAVVPGDYFIVNMVEDEGKIPDLYNRAMSERPINNYDDGFKGFFKVHSVHEKQVVSAQGQRSVVFEVTGYSFPELGNVIYFNPFLLTAGEKNNIFYFLTSLTSNWNKNIKFKQINSVQNVIRLLYEAFVAGKANFDSNEVKAPGKRTPNSSFKIPPLLGKLMGQPSASSPSQLINFFAGVQKYSSADGSNEYQKQYPGFKSSQSRFYKTEREVRGSSYAKPEYWNQIKVWDIINQYLNPVINEIYTTFKVDPSDSKNPKIYPTIVLREKPFTTREFAGTKDGHTLFDTLPRWEVKQEFVLNYSIGRDDAARINFVQVFGRNQTNNPDSSLSFQIAKGNSVISEDDVIRSGLRPFITTSPFDWSEASEKEFSLAPYWAKLASNWLIGGHLKLSGNISCAGIQKPICVGDNLQFRDTVFHIEQISHQASVNPNGKTFRTNLLLSNGLLDETRSDRKPYDKMKHVDADKLRENTGDSYPGVSDSQDLPGAFNRENGEKVEKNNAFDFYIDPKGVKK